MMPHKEAPRKHPWVLPRKVATGSPRGVRQPRQLPWLDFLTNGKGNLSNALTLLYILYLSIRIEIPFDWLKQGRKETDINHCLNFPRA